MERRRRHHHDPEEGFFPIQSLNDPRLSEINNGGAEDPGGIVGRCADGVTRSSLTDGMELNDDSPPSQLELRPLPRHRGSSPKLA